MSNEINDNLNAEGHELKRKLTDQAERKISMGSHIDLSKEAEEENHFHYTCIRRFCGPINEGSLRGAIIAVASITFGGGCLSFPYAISCVGPVLGFFIFTLSGILSLITLNYLLNAAFHLHILNYNGLIEEAIGRKVRIVNDIANIVVCIGIFINYQYIISSLFLNVLSFLFNIDPNGIAKPIAIVSFAIIQISLCMIKDISILQYVGLVGTIALGFSIMLIIAEFPFYLKEYTKHNTIEIFPPNGVGWNFLDAFGIFIYGFCSHNGIFQVLNELSRAGKRRCYKVINRSFWLEVALYFPLSFSGFFSTFYNTPDIFLKRDNLPYFDDYLIIIVKILLIFTLNACVAMNYNIMRLSLKTMFFNNEDPSVRVDRIIVIVIFIFSTAVSFFIKNAGTMFSFLGGVSTAILSFITPILLDLLVNRSEKHWLRVVLNYVFLIFISIIAIACSAKSMYDLITN